MLFVFVVLHALLNHRIPAKFTPGSCLWERNHCLLQDSVLFLEVDLDDLHIYERCNTIWCSLLMQGWRENKDSRLTCWYCNKPFQTKSLKMQLHAKESMSLWFLPPLDSMCVANDAKGGIVGLKIIQSIQDIWNELFCVPPLLLTTRTIWRTKELIVIKAW